MATVQEHEPTQPRRGLIRAREAVAALGPRGEWITPRMVREFLLKRDRAGCSQTDAIEACREWREAVQARPIVQTVERAFQSMDMVELDKAKMLLGHEFKLRALLKAQAMKRNPGKARRA